MQLRVVRSWIKKCGLRWKGARIGKGVYIAPAAKLRGGNITIGSFCYFGDGVTIAADTILIGDECYFADGSSMRASKVEVGFNCVVFPHVRIHCLGEIHIKDYAKIGRGAVLRAGRIEIGNEFWMNTDAEIGGGGWRTGDSAFLAGDRCHVGRGTHINVARPVRLGNDTAIGMDCIVATHAHWQPVTMGYPTHTAPVTLGSDVAVYSRSIIGPGVTIGAGSTIAAGSVVLKDVAEHQLAGGAPASTLRAPIGQGAEAAAVWSLLDAQIKKQFPGTEIEVSLGSRRAKLPNGYMVIMAEELSEPLASGAAERLIAILFGSLASPPETAGAECLFDLSRRQLYGRSSDVSESLRAIFFSMGVRFAYHGYKRRKLSYHELIESGID